MPAATTDRARRPLGMGVEPVELFFDVVFVFAVTQISHHLLGRLDLEGALQSGILLGAVWWAWISVTWLATFLPTDRPAVRGTLLALMVPTLVVASALPHAFEHAAATFAIAYVALHVLRSALGALLLPRSDPMRTTFWRVLAWNGFAAVPWLAGAAVHGHGRVELWCVALLIDYGAPAVRYRTPRLGRSDFATWSVDTGHFAERFGLFVLICLGESVVLLGTAAQARIRDPATLTALALGVAVTAALWWLYFASASRGHGNFGRQRGRVALHAYTYGHIPLVAGVIAVAVGGELTVAEPLHHLSRGGAICLLGGCGLYVIGLARIRLLLFEDRGAAVSASVAAAALLAGIPLAWQIPGLTAFAAVVAVLASLLFVDGRHDRRMNPEPSMPARGART